MASEDEFDDTLDDKLDDTFDDDSIDAEASPTSKAKAGGRNYITQKGVNRLKAEYEDLFRVERPKLVETIAWAASNGDRSENADYIYGKRRLREIDRRIHYLTRRLEAAVVVEPKEVRSVTVVFGATVTLSDEESKVVKYQIVGEDESDIAQGHISWLSPIAQALLGKKIGEEAVVQRPAGEKIYVIEKIEYQ